jgi:hypothetical protein
VCNGFCTVDVPPSPNDQTHELGEFVDESINWTVSGEVPDSTVALNAADGADAKLLAVI